MVLMAKNRDALIDMKRKQKFWYLTKKVRKEKRIDMGRERN